MDSNGMVEIADFSEDLTPKQFRINEDVFLCAPTLPLGTLTDVANFKIDTEQIKEHGLEPILSFFDKVFYDESALRFRERVDSKTEPIGLTHVMKIIPWLLEVYGLRPTGPSELFSLSQESGGMTSTGGASLVGSTLSNSPSPASSTSSITTSEPSPSVA